MLAATLALPENAVASTSGKLGPYQFSTAAKAGQAGQCVFSGSSLTAIRVASPLVKMRAYWTQSHGHVNKYGSQIVEFTATLQAQKGSEGWRTIAAHFVGLGATLRWKRMPADQPFTARAGLRAGYDRYRVVETLQWLRPTDGRPEGTARITLAHYADGRRWVSACLPAPRGVSSVTARATTRSVALAWRNPSSPSLARIVVRYSRGAIPPTKPSAGYPITLNSARAQSVAIRTDEGAAYAFSIWGRDAAGRYSPRTTTVVTTPPITATTVPGLTGVVAVAPGDFHTCALISGGTVKCWGYDGDGELGRGRAGPDERVPAQVPGLYNVTALSSGYEHTCALLSDGTIRCWGYNHFGELGDGTTTSRATPVAVSGIHNAVGISAGPSQSETTCAVLSDGTAKCWGDNEQGELGDGTHTNRHTPVTVYGLSGATQIGVGYRTTCAIVTGGRIECWGSNREGEFGNGTTTSSNSPAAATGLTGATSLAVGGFHECASFSSGPLECWGDNKYGEIGDGTTTNRPLPVLTTDPDPARAPTAGEIDSCSITVGGKVKCWGGNRLGVLGDGSSTDRHSATYVRGVSNATSVVAGDYDTCAVISDGTARCWGLDSDYQLGFS